MTQEQIFGPVLALMLLTLAVWVCLFARRIPFIQSLDLDPNELTPELLASRSPRSVLTPSDNLKNLFEIPVLFYALALYLFVTNQVDSVYLGAAWLFVILRALHSLVHCTVNIVTLRFALYALSCVCVFTILIRAAVAHFF